MDLVKTPLANQLYRRNSIPVAGAFVQIEIEKTTSGQVELLLSSANLLECMARDKKAVGFEHFM